MVGIYKITNNINNKIYIGQSIDIYRRFKEHIREARLNKSNMPIHKAFIKYGIKNFSLVVLEKCEENMLDELEIYYISKLDSTNKNIGYNICKGGNTGPIKQGTDHNNAVLTEEIVSKIRYLYLEGYTRKQAYDRINKKYPININTFADVWIGKTYKNIYYHVYNVEYKESIKKFRNINRSKLCYTDSKKYVLEIRNCRASGEQHLECYKLKFENKININTFNDI